MIVFLTDEPAIATMGPGNTVALVGGTTPMSEEMCLLVLDRRPFDSRVLLKGSNVPGMKRVALEIQRRIKAHGDSPNNLVIEMDDVVKVVFK